MRMIIIGGPCLINDCRPLGLNQFSIRFLLNWCRTWQETESNTNTHVCNSWRHRRPDPGSAHSSWSQSCSIITVFQSKALNPECTGATRCQCNYCTNPSSSVWRKTHLHVFNPAETPRRSDSNEAESFCLVFSLHRSQPWHFLKAERDDRM